MNTSTHSPCEKLIWFVTFINIICASHIFPKSYTLLLKPNFSENVAEFWRVDRQVSSGPVLWEQSYFYNRSYGFYGKGSFYGVCWGKNVVFFDIKHFRDLQNCLSFFLIWRKGKFQKWKKIVVIIPNMSNYHKDNLLPRDSFLFLFWIP